MKLPSVAPLWGGEQWTPLKAIQWSPATSQRVENGTASPSDSLLIDAPRGRVCLRAYRKRNQVCSWQFLQSPHSFTGIKQNVPLLKLLTLGFNWMPWGQQFTFIARRREGPLGVTVNPRNRLTLGTLLLQWTGSLKISMSQLLNFWFSKRWPLEAFRVPPLHPTFGAQLGTWLHLISIHFDFLVYF